LDAFLAAAMRPAEQLFAERGLCCLLPLAVRPGREGALVAVGAAHLVGPDGLAVMLRSRGYRVTSIR